MKKHLLFPTDMPPHIVRERMVELDVPDDDPELLARLWGIQPYPGYPTPFTRREVLGAIRNGTRIMKVWSEQGDTRAPGAQGVVLGSMLVPQQGLAYFVEWDDAPQLAVFVVAKKIADARSKSSVKRLQTLIDRTRDDDGPDTIP